MSPCLSLKQKIVGILRQFDKLTGGRWSEWWISNRDAPMEIVNVYLAGGNLPVYFLESLHATVACNILNDIVDGDYDLDSKNVREKVLCAKIVEVLEEKGFTPIL